VKAETRRWRGDGEKWRRQGNKKKQERGDKHGTKEEERLDLTNEPISSLFFSREGGEREGGRDLKTGRKQNTQRTKD
jgi:hypothetical protein